MSRYLLGDRSALLIQLYAAHVDTAEELKMGLKPDNFNRLRRHRSGIRR